MRNLLVSLGVTALIAFSGCGPDPNTVGYTLPQGDAARGEANFLRFRCYDCHGIDGVDLPVAEEPNQVIVKLGGKVARRKTYGELVTSIVNPSHKLAVGYAQSLVAIDGQSRMTVYNDVMTIRELIDIVEFLKDHYELQPYEPTIYTPYY